MNKCRDDCSDNDDTDDRATIKKIAYCQAAHYELNSKKTISASRHNDVFCNRYKSVAAYQEIWCFNKALTTALH